jgi:hypothetical protein
MAKPKIPAKVVQVCMTHDGRVASLLYDNGRVFVFNYTTLPFGNNAGKGFWFELTYPDTKVVNK